MEAKKKNKDQEEEKKIEHSGSHSERFYNPTVEHR